MQFYLHFLDKKPPKDWPDKGQIVFQSFYLSYGPNTHYVLQNININIQPMEKVNLNAHILLKICSIIC